MQNSFACSLELVQNTEASFVLCEGYVSSWRTHILLKTYVYTVKYQPKPLVLGLCYLLDQNVSKLNAANLLHARGHKIPCSVASIQGSCHSCLQAICYL